MKNIWFYFFPAFLMLACSSSPKRPKMAQNTNWDCQQIFEAAPLSDVLNTLSKVSELYDLKCYQEVISLGDFVRTHSRDKYYQLVNETLEFVTPEGSFTEYVLESYERSYLSFLMASSYEQLALKDDSQVELRKAYLESQALIYNYGDDPVNLVLQAALWENSRTVWNSRPLWKKVAELAQDNVDLKKFAEQRIQDIDSGKKASKSWTIEALGKFPDLDWRTDLKKSSGSYFSIQPHTSFMATCSSKESLLLPTEVWAQKISHKYDRSYHPLLHMQTWTRLPVGLTVGAANAITGAGVAVAGCGLDFYISSRASGSEHPLCNASVAAGGKIIGQTGTVTGYVLRPDLRFWREVPAAFYITQSEDPSKDLCQPKWSGLRKRMSGPENDPLPPGKVPTNF